MGDWREEKRSREGRGMTSIDEEVEVEVEVGLGSQTSRVFPKLEVVEVHGNNFNF